jgi:hypothetical protein
LCSSWAANSERSLFLSRSALFAINSLGTRPAGSLQVTTALANRADRVVGADTCRTGGGRRGGGRDGEKTKVASKAHGDKFRSSNEKGEAFHNVELVEIASVWDLLAADVRAALPASGDGHSPPSTLPFLRLQSRSPLAPHSAPGLEVPRLSS